MSRAGNSSSFISPYFEQVGDTLISCYAYLADQWIVRDTISGVVSIEQNYAHGAAPPWSEAESQHAGIASYTSTDDNYIAMISQAANQFQLVKQVANVETTLALRSLDGLATLALGTKYRIDLKVNNGNVTASLFTESGVLIDTVTVADASFTRGTPGFHSYSVKSRLWSVNVFD